MQYWLEQIFMLNSFEVDTFEKQKMYTQVLFEDLPMIFLQALICFEILKVPGLKNDILKSGSHTTLYWSIFMSIYSILTNFLSLIIESRGLNEYWMEFIMLTMRAKQDWVPYGSKIMYKKIKHDIDYNIIEFKIPIISDMLGLYQLFPFQFTEQGLKKLTYQLGKYHSTSKSGEDNFKPSFKFGFSLYNITVR